jgi:hypothetical protein
MKKLLLLLPLIIILIAGCKQEKLDINDFHTEGSVNTGDTVYISLGKQWGGFNNPSAMIMGHDNFIYVCDKDNNRIVMLNTAGTVMSIKTNINHPVAITQDYRDNLIVCAEFDTVISGATVTYSAVYKIDLYGHNHELSAATATRIVPVKSADFVTTRKYTGAVAFYDNSYYIARNGPNNSSIYDPDNSLIKYAPKKNYGGGDGDTLIGRVADIDPLSTGLISAYGINSMTSFAKQNTDFIATFSSETSFKVQWFHHYVSETEDKYVSKYTPSDNVAFALPDRFGKPTGTCLDASSYIYVADSQKDSVFKFSTYGVELQSFGGPTVFSKPVAVMHNEKTLYVLDAGKNAILRFQLSTDTK